VIYSIEPSAILCVNYRGGKTVSIDLNCGCGIVFHTLAIHADNAMTEVMVGRDTVWKCPRPCDKPCPVMLEERDDQAAH
jgi:hypothetical protein